MAHLTFPVWLWCYFTTVVKREERGSLRVEGCQSICIPKSGKLRIRLWLEVWIKGSSLPDWKISGPLLIYTILYSPCFILTFIWRPTNIWNGGQLFRISVQRPSHLVRIERDGNVSFPTELQPTQKFQIPQRPRDLFLFVFLTFPFFMGSVCLAKKLKNCRQEVCSAPENLRQFNSSNAGSFASKHSSSPAILVNSWIKPGPNSGFSDRFSLTKDVSWVTPLISWVLKSFNSLC